MSPEDVVALYYDAWISKRGDMSAVPLAPDFKFRGPVGSFDDAEGYRAMARAAAAMVTSFTVRLEGSGSTAYGIMVLTTNSDRIIEITGFADPALFPAFGLPVSLEG